MTSLLIGIALIFSVVFGRLKKVNIGLVAIPCAYLIGVFCLHMSPKQVVTLWPISLFFTILAVSLFFGFAAANGTLEVLANNLLYHFRKFPALLPIAFFLVAALVSALGAGYYAVMVLLVPVVLVICRKMHISMIIGALAVELGCQAGSNFMVALNGVIFRNLITQVGYSSNLAFKGATSIFIAYFITASLIVIALLVYSHIKNDHQDEETQEEMDLEKPKAFSHEQRLNLLLILIFMLALLIPPIWHLIDPHNAQVTFVNSIMDVGFLSLIFTIIAYLLGLGRRGKIMDYVPWNTILMISGMGMLGAIAAKAGTIQLLARSIEGAPHIVIPVAFALIACLMNTFCGSYLGVVAPAMFPVVAAVAHTTGMDPVLLFTCTTVGGLSAGISPFSAGGAMTIGFVKKEERDDMFKKTLYFGVPFSAAIALIVVIVYSLIVNH